MLIKCPECELNVSDKAITCPHCGYPLKPYFQKSPPRNFSKKHRRLPNGFGQITKINKNLRKPYRAMVTVGKTPEGRPICKLLKPVSYFESYNEAYEALIEYNKNPFSLDDDCTMAELYSRWSAEHFKTISAAGARNLDASWQYCHVAYNYSVKSMHSKQLRALVENATLKDSGKEANARTKVRIKSLLNCMFDYAVEYELTDKNYARNFSLAKDTMTQSETPKNSHLAFTDDEMKKLWEALGKKKYADMLLIQCYSGWRPKELLTLEIANINLEAGTMIGGSKTEAGVDRIVPIHPRILPLIKARLENNSSKYLFRSPDDSKPLSYSGYRNGFDKLISELGLNINHRPHDPRKQFVTMAKLYGVDEYAIKRIVGHKIADLTERVYTARDVEWLASEIKKIK